jgi:hypothetical protein
MLLALALYASTAHAHVAHYDLDLLYHDGRRSGPASAGAHRRERGRSCGRAESPARAADGPADVARACGHAPAGRTACRNSSTGRVFSTSRAVRRPRRAMSIP